MSLVGLQPAAKRSTKESRGAILRCAATGMQPPLPYMRRLRSWCVSCAHLAPHPAQNCSLRTAHIITTTYITSAQDQRALSVHAQSLVTAETSFKLRVQVSKSLLRHLRRSLRAFPTDSLKNPGAMRVLNNMGLDGFLALLQENCGREASLWDAEALCNYLLAQGH